ncbi:hypothetical protein PRZ48_014536 [Zasmidium cellare]|uniref:DUF4185 domain-containing protein n=1 Tax=Zasmidium cellare TaxID=395010 RepID=A0ABR0DYI0_ZASCE|nr:hypothetical protein PRZ48_014536 [Zasmidium cellare]
MELLLVLVAIAAFFQTSANAQYGRKQFPGQPPYRPFPPYRQWPHKRPSPPPPTSQQPVYPKLKTTPQILGLANDPALDRDSCGSMTFVDRTFWTCRDTQLFYPNGSVMISPLITSTASWSDFNRFGAPALQQLPPGADVINSTVLKLYGKNTINQAFYPILPDYCDPPAGNCSDGTRYALWPDLPPMITSSGRGGVTGYTWIRTSHIRSDLSTVTDNPNAILYKVTYQGNYFGNRNALPQVSVVDEFFWKEGEITFGNYGNVVKDGIAYLYGQAEGITSLAKVPANQVENKAAYQYWVDGKWTKTMPAIGQEGINITSSNAGGQGTYYFSDKWNSYVWVGGGNYPGSDMFITTAPAPTGPWITPQKFFTGINGNYFLSAYSIQAHPGLAASTRDNDLYVTYTKNDLDSEGINVYTSPLVYIQWQ